MNLQKLEKEYTLLNQEIKTLEERIANLPEGYLICSRNGTRYKWYHCTPGNYQYIPKSNRQLATQLAQKKYLSLQLSDAERKKKAIENYMKPYISNKNNIFAIKTDSSYSSSFDNTLLNGHKSIMTTNTADQFLLSNPEFKNLIKDYYSPRTTELEAWRNEEYRKNMNHPENLIHKSISGNLVRSKSEAMIDMVLYKNQIPYRYECELQIGPNTFYPDFTIRHPQTGKYFYWEHFGRMDDPSYFKNVYSKLHTYTTFGIIPSINLITTYETQENPLSFQELERIIENYFL